MQSWRAIDLQYITALSDHSETKRGTMTGMKRMEIVKENCPVRNSSHVRHGSVFSYL